jgi:hypothetical protein
MGDEEDDMSSVGRPLPRKNATCRKPELVRITTTINNNENKV